MKCWGYQRVKKLNDDTFRRFDTIADDERLTEGHTSCDRIIHLYHTVHSVVLAKIMYRQMARLALHSWTDSIVVVDNVKWRVNPLTPTVSICLHL